MSRTKVVCGECGWSDGAVWTLEDARQSGWYIDDRAMWQIIRCPTCSAKDRLLREKTP